MKSASLLLTSLFAAALGLTLVGCQKSQEGGGQSASQSAGTPAAAAPATPAAPEPPATSAAPAPAAPAPQPAAPATPPAAAPSATPPPAAGSARMDFSIPLQPMSNPPVNFQAYRGRPVLLFYFGPTCPHCQAATPEIQAFSDEIRAKGVETLAIANMRSNPQEIGEFISKYHVRVPVYWDVERKFGEAYNVKSLPTLYLVGKAGDIFRLDNFSGKASLDSLRARI